MASYDKGRNLYTGGGILFFAEKQGAAYGPLVYFGKTKNVALTLEKDTIEAYDTEGCEPTLDGEVVTKRSARIAITSTQISPSNLARAVNGTITDNTQAEATDQLITTSAVTIGAVTDYGYVGATSVVVKDETDTTTHVEGIDYELVKKAGFIIPLDGGAITDGDILNITVSAPAFEGVIISAMKLHTLEGAFVLVTNSNTGNDYKYVFKNAQVSQDGDLQIKGAEDFTELNLTGVVTSDRVGTSGALSDYYDIYTLPSGECEKVTLQ